MIDHIKLKEKILFVIQHHGTNTQGKAFRENQVAEYLTDLFFQIERASLEIEKIREVYDKVNIDLTVR